MRELEKPVGRVLRRMRFQRFLSALVWCWCAALVVVTGVLVAEKLGRALPGPDWLPLAVAGGLGLAVAALFAIFSGPNRVDAAVAIDRAFHLNERLSTSLTLPSDLRETPAGRALLADTVRHVSDLNVGEKFGLRMPRLAWVPLLPAVIAGLLLFAPEWTQRIASAKSRTPTKAEREVVTKSAMALSKKIAAQRKDLDKNQFEEADKILAEIEKATQELAKAPPSEKDKALVELNKLSDALKERQKQLGGTEAMTRQLKQLKDMTFNGPADKFAKELAKGDFAQATQELKKLQEKLASGKMSETEKKALKEQLSEMKQQLEKLANLEERKKQLEDARKNGALTQKQFEQEMAKLQEQSKGMEKLKQLAQKLGQAQEAMEKGDNKAAAQALGMGEKELNQLAKQLKEMDALDGALAELQDAKNGMSEDALNQLGSQLDGMNRLGMNDSMRKGSNQMMRGRGQGDRPEAPDDVSSYNTQVKQQYTKGKAVLEGFSNPRAQTKGQSILEDVEAAGAAGGFDAEALSNQKIPKGIQKHILNYYDQINKGK
ncbi:MAG TPA: hypothetical protein VGY53_02670 [Isosphaeraceae bacterium]|nr:hypothetical protein [Isosphaeraceae bacterium]